MLMLLRGAQPAHIQHVYCHLSGQQCIPRFRAVRASARASIRTGALAMALRNESKEERAARKQAVKEEKAAKRERKQGNVPEGYGQKPCDLCEKQSDLLIRCQTSAEDHAEQRWHMVCGKCWNKVSGGVVDGDKEHPWYRYGGLWKNLHKQDAA